jgi:uncharacterized protein (TIGR02118 family)
MVKVVWFLKKAEHLTMEEFRRWWLEGHAPMITARQGHLISRYVVNIRAEDDLPGNAATAFDWDGMAEEWFESMDDARRAFSLPSAPETRADVMAHVSAMSRLVVSEHPIHGRTAAE